MECRNLGVFGGPKNAYIYPDMSTALVGKFSQGKILSFSLCHLDYPQEYIFAKQMTLAKGPTKSFYTRLSESSWGCKLASCDNINLLVLLIHIHRFMGI